MGVLIVTIWRNISWMMLGRWNFGIHEIFMMRMLGEFWFHEIFMKEFFLNITNMIPKKSKNIFSWNVHARKKFMSFFPLELLSQTRWRILHFGFRDMCFQTYRCPKWHVSVWEVLSLNERDDLLNHFLDNYI